MLTNIQLLKDLEIDLFDSYKIVLTNSIIVFTVQKIISNELCITLIVSYKLHLVNVFLQLFKTENKKLFFFCWELYVRKQWFIVYFFDQAIEKFVKMKQNIF